MKTEELVKILINSLKKTKSIKSHRCYQNNNGIQIMTNDGTIFNILPIDVTNMGSCIVSKRFCD